MFLWDIIGAEWLHRSNRWWYFFLTFNIHLDSSDEGPTISHIKIKPLNPFLQLKGSFIKVVFLLWTLWPTTVCGPRHSCSRTWCRCSSCQCHRHISGCRDRSHPSRNASRWRGPPTTYRASHLGSKQTNTQTFFFLERTFWIFATWKKREKKSQTKELVLTER